MFIKIMLLVVFFVLTIFIGIYTKKFGKNVNDFVLGGRKVGPWITAFAFGTSYFSAVIFVGYSGQFGWNFGLASTWIGLGNALIGSLLAWWLLAKRTRKMSQHLEAQTMPQFFEKRYKSKALKIVASLIIFVFLIPYTASLFNGLSRLFEMAFGIDYIYCVVGMALLTGFYVIFGGYMATAINDFIQGIIMLGGIVAVVIAVLNTQGGLFTAISSLSQVPVNGETGLLTSLFGPDMFSLACVVVLTSLGTWGLPQMITKFYAIKDTASIKKGMIISTIFALVVAGGSYFLGGFGRLFTTSENVAVNGFDSIIPTMLQYLPDIMIGIVIVLVMSASMSTLSSLVLTSSSTITLDFIAPFKKNGLTEKQKLICMRIFLGIFIIISSVIAIIQIKSHVTFIAQLMGISWGALAGSFLAPFLYGLYSKKITRGGVWFCFGFGTITMILNLLFKSSFLPFLQSPINAGVFVMLLSLIILPIISRLTPQLPKEHIDFVFSENVNEDTSKNISTESTIKSN